MSHVSARRFSPTLRSSRRHSSWISLILLLVSLPGWALNAQTPVAPTPLTRQVYLMGTVCTFTIFTEERGAGIEQVEEYVRILEQAEQELSTWINNSAVSRLNRHPLNTPFQLSESLCPLFRQLIDWNQRTGSAFDPAVGSLMDLRGLSAERESNGEIFRDAQEASGMKHLQFDPSRCEVTRLRDIRLDPGAFGKGEALDRVFRHAHSEGQSPWLIDFGGQVLVAGLPPGQSVWSVDLAHPIDRSRPFLNLKLSSGSLATSGGSERDLIVDNRRIGHIFDPRNGLPVALPGSVTVWHPTAQAADILSTALFVMGPKAGLDWAESREIAACFLIISADSVGEGSILIQATTAFTQRFFRRTKYTGT